MANFCLATDNSNNGIKISPWVWKVCFNAFEICSFKMFYNTLPPATQYLFRSLFCYQLTKTIWTVFHCWRRFSWYAIQLVELFFALQQVSTFKIVSIRWAKLVFCWPFQWFHNKNLCNFHSNRKHFPFWQKIISSDELMHFRIYVNVVINFILFHGSKSVRKKKSQNDKLKTDLVGF